MLVSCLFFAISLLLVGRSHCVPIFSVPDTGSLLGGVTNTAGGIVPAGGKLNGLSPPTGAAPISGLVPEATSTVKNLLTGALGDDALGKREPTASPPTIGNFQNPSQGLSGVGSTIQQAGSSALGPVSSQPLVAVGKIPTLPVVGSPSLPTDGTLSSLPAVKLPSGTKLPDVGSGLPLGAASSVPQNLSAVGSPIHQTGSSAPGSVSSDPLTDVAKVPSLPAVVPAPSLPAVEATSAKVPSVLPDVGSGLPLGAVTSVPKTLSGVTGGLI